MLHEVPGTLAVCRVIGTTAAACCTNCKQPPSAALQPCRGCNSKPSAKLGSQKHNFMVDYGDMLVTCHGAAVYMLAEYSSNIIVEQASSLPRLWCSSAVPPAARPGLAEGLLAAVKQHGFAYVHLSTLLFMCLQSMAAMTSCRTSKQPSPALVRPCYG